MAKITEKKDIGKPFLFQSKPFRGIRSKGSNLKMWGEKRKKKKGRTWRHLRLSCKFTCYVPWAGPRWSRYLIGFVSHCCLLTMINNV